MDGGTKEALVRLEEGWGDPDVREKYYPGWTSKDFRRVIDAVDSEYRQKMDAKAK